MDGAWSDDVECGDMQSLYLSLHLSSRMQTLYCPVLSSKSLGCNPDLLDSYVDLPQNYWTFCPDFPPHVGQFTNPSTHYLHVNVESSQMIQLLLDFCPGECSQKIAKSDRYVTTHMPLRGMYSPLTNHIIETPPRTQLRSITNTTTTITT